MGSPSYQDIQPGTEIAPRQYQVTRRDLVRYAGASGDFNPIHWNERTAKAVGLPDVIAPPTFAIVVTSAATKTMMADPGLGVNYAMIVHGEQSFAHSRPLHAGDVVVAQATIESIKPVRTMTTLTTVTEIRTVDGEHVCTARSTLVERGA